jgi:hypothetical protein
MLLPPQPDNEQVMACQVVRAANAKCRTALDTSASIAATVASRSFWKSRAYCNNFFFAKSKARNPIMHRAAQIADPLGLPGNDVVFQTKRRDGMAPVASQLLCSLVQAPRAPCCKAQIRLAGDPSEVTALGVRHWITSFHC